MRWTHFSNPNSQYFLHNLFFLGCVPHGGTTSEYGPEVPSSSWQVQSSRLSMGCWQWQNSQQLRCGVHGSLLILTISDVKIRIFKIRTSTSVNSIIKYKYEPKSTLN
jgi:hypothetical protein